MSIMMLSISSITVEYVYVTFKSTISRQIIRKMRVLLLGKEYYSLCILASPISLRKTKLDEIKMSLYKYNVDT